MSCRPGWICWCSTVRSIKGTKRAVKFLQQAANVTADGVIGRLDPARAWRRAPVASLCRDFCARRGVAYAKLSIFRFYGYGWFRRLFDAHHEATLLLDRGEP